jgi:diguanylate cyclase (GGDEF)-like protein/PAS domain S-box-containing protein
LLSQALNAVSEGSLITDAAQDIVYSNEAFTAITGYTAAEIRGRNCRFLQGPGSDPLTVAALRSSLERGESYRAEILNYRKDGAPFWNALTISPIRNAQGTVTHFVSVQRDVTAQKALQSRLRFLALHDPVTGLQNRTALDQYLGRITDASPPGTVSAVGVIDLDDFKIVNDTHGHAAGDLLLRELGARLQAQLRATDFLARLGGDEFVVVISGLAQETAHAELVTVLGRLHRAVEPEFLLGEDVAVRVGMSMGLSLHPAHRSNEESSLRRADRALYVAKRNKNARTRWWYLDDGPDTPVEAARSHPAPNSGPKHGGEYRDLLEAPPEVQWREKLLGGGLRMLYQPVMDLRTGAVSAVEALARIKLDNGPCLEPKVFTHLLTGPETDLLFRLGLDAVLEQLRQWDTNGLHLSASVNLAPSTLLHPGCVSWVRSALADHGIAPQRLSLEVLENLALDDPVQARTFDELHGLGVRMVLDDLGSGYSSLRRLTAFAFSTVKVDREVLCDLRSAPISTLTFLASLIQMGRDMGWDVVAEGLEDLALTEAATILGTPHGQGYFIARPLQAEAVPGWIRNFVPPLQRGTIETALGALAYHLQFARLGSPHPGALEGCPLTPFLRTVASADDSFRQWHAHQHADLATHAKCASRLTQWLTDLIKAQQGSSANTGVATAAGGSELVPGLPQFITWPLDP